MLIGRVGAARDLVIHDLEGEVLDTIRMQPGDSYELTGEVNMLVKHSVPACADYGLCVPFSWRRVRNRVSPDGGFAVVNGKRVPLDYLEQALEKKKITELQAMCDRHRIDTTGKKDDLLQRLCALPGDARRQLEVEVLARGHTPEEPVVTRALRVQGPELAELMLAGDKIVENRSVHLGLGW